LAGETLILHTTYGLHAIGLPTGRRLWSRRFDPPVEEGRPIVAADHSIWAERGFVASVDGYGTVEVAPVEAGDQVLWRRQDRTRGWHAVRIRGDYVIAANEGLSRIDVFRLADGGHVGQASFKQPPKPKSKISLGLFDEVICGTVTSRSVAGIELATPGVERWRVDLPVDIERLFKPTSDLVGVADGAGWLQIINPVDGNIRFSSRVRACAGGVIDGVVVDDVLYTYGYRVAAQGRQPLAHRDGWALAAVSMEDGRVLWQRDDLDASAHLSQDLLRSVRGAIPVVRVERGRDPDHNQRSAPGDVYVDLLDQGTGATLETIGPVKMPEGTSTQRIIDVWIRPDSVLVVTEEAYLSFPILPDDGSLQASRNGGEGDG
jgi:hypothetical protein